MFIHKERKRLLLPAISMVFAFMACNGNKKETAEIREGAIAVSIAIAGSSNAEAISGSGQIESSHTANISTRVMGRITTIKVKAGDHVTKGQLLATISDEDINAKRAQVTAMINEAAASYATAKKDFDRFTVLYSQQSATARELDNITLQYNAAKSRLEGARQQQNEVDALLSYCSLTAPFEGIVSQKLAEVGSIANPGMTILTIEQNATLQVSAAIAETDIVQVRIGDTAVVTVKSADRLFTGRIIQLNPSSQFTGGQYIVKINIPESEKKGLYPGMYVNLSIPVKYKGKLTNPDLLLIPQSAVVNRDELTGIYTVSNNHTALLRWIRLGRQYGDKVEVLSGLANNESFIVHAEGKLYNEVPITINKQ